MRRSRTGAVTIAAVLVLAGLIMLGTGSATLSDPVLALSTRGYRTDLRGAGVDRRNDDTTFLLQSVPEGHSQTVK